MVYMTLEANQVGGLTPANGYYPAASTPGANQGAERVPVGGEGTSGSRPGLALEREQSQVERDFNELGLGLTKEQVKAEQRRLGIESTFAGKLTKSGMKEERVIELHNQYAMQIFKEAYGDDPVLMDLAQKYIAELPKAGRKNKEQEFISACEQKLEAFRAAVNDYNLALNQGMIDQNAQARYEAGETAADLRARGLEETIVETGESLKEHITETGDRVIKEVNAHTSRVGNSVVGQIKKFTDERVTAAETNINNNTNERVGQAEENINSHTDERVGQAEDNINQHTTETVNRGVREVNEHTTAEAEKTRLTNQQQAVLDAKRQTISDMLMNEANESFPGAGHYRDKTVKWLGSSADRVMASTGLTFEQKKEALDELVRMVDEENVISDGDRAAFEAKYFYDTEEKPHI